MNDVVVAWRRVTASLAGCAACLLFVFATLPPAWADNPPPSPHVTGPAQVNNRGPLTLEFSYPSVPWTYQSFWHLWYWAQYWHCQLGKDTQPTEIALQSEPWPGHENPCTREDNRYLGLDPGQTRQSIPVPRSGGVPQTGIWYVRVRLVWRASQPNFQPEPGPWSAWHRVAVVPSFQDAALPPRVVAPADQHLFINQDVDVRVMAARRHPDPSRWEYAFEWQRADYHTRADNAYANPHPKPSDFPRVLGLASPFRPWSTSMPVQTLAEGATASTLHLNFSDLHSGRHDSSYIYRFRVRERLRSGAAGPWSGWHSFIVSEPLLIKPLGHPMTRIKHP